MRTLRWSRWGLLSMCCAASAFAAEGDNPAELFDKLDVNKDGQVTIDEVPEEHRAHLERLLRKGDKDENKSLSKAEWEAAHTPDAPPEIAGPGGREGRTNPGQMFERMDANKDGKLQKSEIPEGAPQQVRDMFGKVFETAGKDELTREELIAAVGKSMKGKGGGKGGEPSKMIERLKKLDKNGDGKVTSDEIPAEGGERLKGLMEKLGGGDSIDIAKAEEFVAKQAAKMEKKTPDGAGPKKKNKKPSEADEPGDDDRRPEGPPPEGDRRGPYDDGPRMRDDGDGPEGRGDRGHMGHRPHGGFMGLLDENHDGRLSRDEFSRAATYFGDLDQNHDGSLDPHELMGMPGHDGGGRMGHEGRGPRGDRDDGPREGGPEGRPRRDDRGGPDGERMRDDDRRYPGEGGPRPDREGRGPRDDEDRPRPEGGDGERGFDRPRPEGGGPGGRFNPDELWKRLDKDGDGSVTKEEAPERMKEHFDEIDTDKDGKLSKDELRTHREKRMNGRGPGRPGSEGPDGPRPARPEAEGEKAPEQPKDAAPASDKPAGEKPAEEKSEEPTKA